MSYHEEKPPMSADLIPESEIQFIDLSKRGLTEDTCRHYSYGVASYKGRTVQVAQYRDKAGRVVAQKVRTPDKDFFWIGQPAKACALFGQHLYHARKAPGRTSRLTITEGELDALSFSQTQQNRWPVVSLSAGAPNAALVVKKELEYVSSFDEVVLMFDNDEAGQAAIEAVAQVLPPGKVKLVRLPLKDASDMLQAGRQDELVSAFWNAAPYRPDGVVSWDEVWQKGAEMGDVPSWSYPFPQLDTKLRGLRGGEVVTVCAGSGIGKSTVVREVGYHLAASQGERIGWIGLEEGTVRSQMGLLTCAVSRPLHLLPRAEWPDTDAANAALRDKVVFYDHWGSLDSDHLIGKMRFMVRGLGVKFIVLDHLSIVVSGLVEGKESERKTIDRAMTGMRSLVEETGAGLLMVSHLKRRGEGKGYEQGVEPQLSDLRGSASIEQISDIVIGLGRDQQSEDEANVAHLRVLKNRWTGETGCAGYVRYDLDTGRLSEHDVKDASVAASFATAGTTEY